MLTSYLQHPVESKSRTCHVPAGDADARLAKEGLAGSVVVGCDNSPTGVTLSGMPYSERNTESASTCLFASSSFQASADHMHGYCSEPGGHTSL